MEIEFTAHALRRMRERGLGRRQVREFVRDPDTIVVSKKDPMRFLAKKIYHNKLLARTHLLMAVCERERDTLLVITVIDTSQLKKYS